MWCYFPTDVRAYSSLPKLPVLLFHVFELLQCFYASDDSSSPRRAAKRLTVPGQMSANVIAT